MVFLGTFVLLAVGIAPLISYRFWEWSTPMTVPIARAAVCLGLIGGRDADLVRESFRLRTAFPAYRARKAAAANDHRLVGVRGFGLFFPGTNNRNQEEIRREYGEFERVGGGDSANSIYELLYQEESYNFALHYNETILNSQTKQMR